MIKSKILILSLAVMVLAIGFQSILASPSITLKTDKDSYAAGDQVSISGNVNGAPNAPIAIEVKDSSGQTILIRTVQTDSNGAFALQFKAPSSAKAGNFNITASTYAGGTQVSSTKGISYTGQQATTTTTAPISAQTSQPTPSRCLIATAAFGSDLAPQVQFLRVFRDQNILSTASGSSFMNVFNTWYYSFSPSVANYERGQPWMQQIVRTSIYPLLGMLTLSQKAYSMLPGDYGAVTAGLIASSLIGAVYFFPFALAIKQVRKSCLNPKIALSIVAAAVIAVIISIIAANSVALMITTSLLVLTTLSISAIYSANAITKVANKFRRHSSIAPIAK